MEEAPNNPKTNKLGPGVSEALVSTAVEKSGYPLQTYIAFVLRTKKFFVEEEWSYLDSDSGQQRPIDMLARMPLYDPSLKHELLYVRPHLALLIECKQSELPYVFFLSESQRSLTRFPAIAGLFKDNINITTDNTSGSLITPINDVLGLSLSSFVKLPPICTLFSKCLRKDKGLELSGSPSFLEIVMPVLKAISHFCTVEYPPKTARYFDPCICLGIGLLDAPMVGVYLSQEKPRLVSLPWIRVLRHEYSQQREWWDRSQLCAIDIVHKDFFTEYLDKNLAPFANDFSHLAEKHHQVLASGEAYIPKLWTCSYTDYESKLQPGKLKRRAKP